VVVEAVSGVDVDADGKDRHLGSGDLVILPRGDTHWLRDDPASPTLWLEDLLAKDPVDAELRLRSGGTGAISELLCGAFALEGNRQHPVLSAPPSVPRVTDNGDRALPRPTRR